MLDTARKSLSTSQLRELKRFGSKINKFSVNFVVYSADGELVLLCEAGRFKSNTEQLIEMVRYALHQDDKEKSYITRETQVYQLGEHSQVLAAVLRNPVRDAVQESCHKASRGQGLKSDPDGLVALIDLGDDLCLDQSKIRGTRDEDFGELGRAGRETSLSEMLRLFAKSFRAETKAEEQIEKFGTELAKVYEELVLLHKLSTNMKVTEADANFLQMACDSLTSIVNVEGIAILLEKTIDDEKQLVVAAGSGLIDISERMAGILHSRLEDEINRGKEALLDSEVDSPFKYDWPNDIKNIIAVPLYGADKAESHLGEKTQNTNYIAGLMVAINRIDKQDFDSTDTKLFNSVANGCAVFIENGRLFKDLKELFIGSLKALTSSIDAKDKYTRGHSDRVAFISRWIAERLDGQSAEGGLEEEQLHRIYLAGLLHDIGKIGVDEAVLRKEGKLTKEEMDRIRKHPSIGAGILREIRQMRDIMPGVLCHHERVDGKGYPGGLTGDGIPLIGKIVGLADSFDAMTSKRTYRSAKTIEQALVEIEKGLGTQFDEKVGRAFINSDVYQLWDIIMQNSPDFVGIYSKSDFKEYGAAAVGTLIR